MPVFNIPISNARPYRGTLTTEAARLKAKKDKEKKAARTARDARTRPGITLSTQADLQNARTRATAKSLTMKSSKPRTTSSVMNSSQALTNANKSRGPQLTLAQKQAKRKSEAKVAKVQPKIIILQSNELKAGPEIAHVNKDNLKVNTIIPSSPISSSSLSVVPKVKAPSKPVNEKFKTTVPTSNINRTLKVTGLTKEELNKALKLVATKTQNNVLKNLTAKQVKK